MKGHTPAWQSFRVASIWLTLAVVVWLVTTRDDARADELPSQAVSIADVLACPGVFEGRVIRVKAYLVQNPLVPCPTLYLSDSPYGTVLHATFNSGQGVFASREVRDQYEALFDRAEEGYPFVPMAVAVDCDGKLATLETHDCTDVEPIRMFTVRSFTVLRVRSVAPVQKPADERP